MALSSSSSSSSSSSLLLPATAARAAALIDLVALEPEAAGSELARLVYSPHLDTHQRLLALDAFTGAARLLALGGIGETVGASAAAAAALGSKEAPLPLPASSFSSSGVGKSRVWGSALATSSSSSSPSSNNLQTRSTRKEKKKSNHFIRHAVPWATALLSECDVERHGVDLFGRDALLLGRLMTTLAGFVSCATANGIGIGIGGGGESVGVAAPLAAALLELASSPDVRRSPSPYVRRCALAAAASAAGALPPTALLGGGGGGGGGGDSSSSAVAPWERRLQSALDAASSHAATAAAADPDPNVRLLASAARGAYSALSGRALELRVRRDLGALSTGGGVGGVAGIGLGGVEPRIRLPPSSSSSRRDSSSLL